MAFVRPRSDFSDRFQSMAGTRLRINRWMQHTRSCVSRRSVAMKRRPRIYYTESRKAIMWERWRKGESLQGIAELFDHNHSSIQRILAETGGIQPAQRRRSRLALTLAEREEISRSVAAGQSIRSVATRLGRAPSTISREIMRNGGQECYRTSQADQAAWDRGRRPKTCSLAENRSLAHIVAGKLQLL